MKRRRRIKRRRRGRKRRNHSGCQQITIDSDDEKSYMKGRMMLMILIDIKMMNAMMVLVIMLISVY